jgi:hypothetical protein
MNFKDWVDAALQAQGNLKSKTIKEPGMEEILASIRRILSEDDDGCSAEFNLIIANTMEKERMPDFELSKWDKELELKESWMVNPTLSDYKKFFSSVSTSRLTNILYNEYPQTVALVLSILDPEVSSTIIENLPENFAMECIMRVLRMDSISMEVALTVLEKLKHTFLEKEKMLYFTNDEQHSTVANFLSRSGKSSRFMNSLKERNRESWETISNKMKSSNDDQIE